MCAINGLQFKTSQCVISSLFCIVFSVSVATAAGFEPAAVDDGSSRFCIDGQRSKVSIHLTRLVTEKRQGWFFEDTEVVFSSNVTLSGATGSGAKRVIHPLLRTYTLKPYSEGEVTIPTQLPIVSRLQLKNEEREIATIVLDYNIYSVEDDTVLSRILKEAAKISQTLPIPANPYAAGFKLAADYSSTMVSAITNELDQDSKAVLGTQTYEFSENQNCSSIYAQAGTSALIRTVDHDHEHGFVDTNRIGNYCFYTDIGSDRILYAQPRLTDRSQGCDPSGDGRFKVRNPHLMYTIIASQPSAGAQDKQTMFAPSSKPSEYIDFSVSEQAAIVTGYGFSDKDFEVLAKADMPVDFGSTYLVLSNSLRTDVNQSLSAEPMYWTYATGDLFDVSDRFNWVEADFLEATANLERCRKLEIPPSECL